MPCLALLGFLTNSAYASQAALEQTIQLDEQQAKLQNRLERVDQLNNAHGRYVLIRDTYFHSANGVKTQALQWFGESQAWIRQWYEILTIVKNAPDLTSLELQSNLREKLRLQQQQWLKLKNQSETIRFRTEAALEQATKIIQFSESFIPGYEAQIHAFNKKVRALSDTLRASRFAFNADNNALWDALLYRTEQGVLNRLQKAVLSYPHLREALKQVEMNFRVEREVEPLVKKINDRYNEVRDHVYKKRVFHAEEAVATLQREGEEALVAIRATGIEPAYTIDAESTIRTWMTTGRQLFLSATGPFLRSLLVKQNFIRESQEMSGQCKDIVERKRLDCELLRSLLIIPPAEIDRMTSGQLGYFEHQIAHVKRGPLS